MKLIQRWCFVQDDDCHWYLIPADRMAEFDYWADTVDDEPDKYDRFRLGTYLGFYTFTDPQRKL